MGKLGALGLALTSLVLITRAAITGAARGPLAGQPHPHRLYDRLRLAGRVPLPATRRDIARKGRRVMGRLGRGKLKLPLFITLICGGLVSFAIAMRAPETSFLHVSTISIVGINKPCTIVLSERLGRGLVVDDSQPSASYTFTIRNAARWSSASSTRTTTTTKNALVQESTGLAYVLARGSTPGSGPSRVLVFDLHNGTLVL